MNAQRISQKTGMPSRAGRSHAGPPPAGEKREAPRRPAASAEGGV
jgi:hypothetical protein